LDAAVQINRKGVAPTGRQVICIPEIFIGILGREYGPLIQDADRILGVSRADSG
jgi:hypothetical protein